MTVCSGLNMERNVCRGLGNEDESFDSEHAGNEEKEVERKKT